MSVPAIDWTDPAAVAACVEAHRPRLMAFVEQRMSPGLKQRLDADDILQEVCLAAVQPASGKAGIVAGQREPFGWLCHVAEQRVIDAHRRYFVAAKRDGHREVSLDAPRATDQAAGDAGGIASMLAVSMTTPSQALSRDAKEYRLRLLIDGLPDEQREAIRLRYVDGLATRDIAERIGKSDGAVRVMLSRALHRLQSAFPDAAAE